MGHRPVAPVKIGYESVWLYLTLCPLSGQGYACFLPRLDGANFKWFVEQVQQRVSGKGLFVADGATAHKAEYFGESGCVSFVYQRLVLNSIPWSGFSRKCAGR